MDYNMKDFIKTEIIKTFNKDYVDLCMLNSVCTIKSKDGSNCFMDTFSGKLTNEVGGVCTKLSDDCTCMYIANMFHEDDKWVTHLTECKAADIAEEAIPCVHTNPKICTNSICSYEELVTTTEHKYFDVGIMFFANSNVTINNGTTSVDIRITTINKDEMCIEVAKKDLIKLSACINKNINNCISEILSGSKCLIKITPNDIMNTVYISQGDVDVKDSGKITDTPITTELFKFENAKYKPLLTTTISNTNTKEAEHIYKFNTEFIKSNRFYELNNVELDVSVYVYVSVVDNDYIHITIRTADTESLAKLLHKEASLIPEVGLDNEISSFILTATDFSAIVIASIAVPSCVVQYLSAHIHNVMINTDHNNLDTHNNTPLNSATNYQPFVVNKMCDRFSNTKINKNILGHMVLIPLIGNDAASGTVINIDAEGRYITLAVFDIPTMSYKHYKCFIQDVDRRKSITTLATGSCFTDVSTYKYSDIVEETTEKVFNADLETTIDSFISITDGNNIIQARIIDMETTLESDTYLTLEVPCECEITLHNMINMDVSSINNKSKTTKVVIVAQDVHNNVEFKELPDVTNFEICNTEPKIYSLYEALELFIQGYEIRPTSWEPDQYLWWDEENLQMMDNDGRRRYDIGLLVYEDWYVGAKHI